VESRGLFCVGAFGWNLAPVALKMFSHLVQFIKKYYKCCTFSTICEDNTAITVLQFNTKKIRSR
jgi:hypothetical protein